MFLITGSNGFLGRHLIKEFNDQEILAPTRQELNLLDYNLVNSYIKNHPIKYIIHAAGFVGGIGLHEEFPGKIAMENLRMGMNLIESSVGLEHIKLLTVSTVCVYPADARTPTYEDQIYDGRPEKTTGFYGLSKRMLHNLSEAYHKENKFKYITIIPTNLYGPGDHYDENKSHVIPALIKRAHSAKINNEENISIWGSKNVIRDFLYAPDCAHWIRKAIMSDLNNEIINFGSDKGITMEDLANLICEIVGYNGNLIWDKNKPTGAKKRLLSIEKAKSLIGYGNLVKLKDGLIKTYEDFLERNL